MTSIKGLKRFNFHILAVSTRTLSRGRDLPDLTTVDTEMAFSSKLCLMAMVLVAVAVISPDQVEAGWGDCYETWSRCSRWSSPATGYLWLSCNDRCRELGRSGGNCRPAPSSCPLSRKAYQCQCY
ncbi:macin [Plakobranchus ocellatus]|uniref:Macin n=1 Tax=Plakobranchus ocellatus TaxID=259542 RepID=A0AAV4D1H0_9GAST|nr:macin [Plakobranchus ocellatus]